MEGGRHLRSDQDARSFQSPRSGFRPSRQDTPDGKFRTAKKVQFARHVTRHIRGGFRQRVCCLASKDTGHGKQTTAALVVAEGVGKGNAIEPRISASCRPWRHDANLETPDPLILRKRDRFIRQRLGYALRRTWAGIERHGLGSTPAVSRVAFNSECGNPELGHLWFRSRQTLTRPRPQPAGPTAELGLGLFKLTNEKSAFSDEGMLPLLSRPVVMRDNRGLCKHFESTIMKKEFREGAEGTISL